MLNSIILAFSTSVDSLGIGITYGIKKTKISFFAHVVLFAFSLVISYVSIFFGSFIRTVLPDFLTDVIGSLILGTMGCFMIFQSLKEKDKFSNVFNNPISTDLDNSKVIDSKEAVFLAIALSLDIFCVGVGASLENAGLSLFPFWASVFQISFLGVGSFLGRRFNKLCGLPQNIWSIISGGILIFMCILRLCF